MINRDSNIRSTNWRVRSYEIRLPCFSISAGLTLRPPCGLPFRLICTTSQLATMPPHSPVPYRILASAAPQAVLPEELFLAVLEEEASGRGEQSGSMSMSMLRPRFLLRRARLTRYAKFLSMAWIVIAPNICFLLFSFRTKPPSARSWRPLLFRTLDI